jgi:hypothetical protein
MLPLLHGVHETDLFLMRPQRLHDAVDAIARQSKYCVNTSINPSIRTSAAVLAIKSPFLSFY